MQIKALELISESEWNTYKKIDNVNVKMYWWWWTRTKSSSNAYYVRRVGYDGFIDDGSAYDDSVYVRPAARIKTAISLKIGQIVYLKYKGTLVPFVCVKRNKENNYILFANSLYDNHRFDSNSNEYETSEIREYVHSMIPNFSNQLYVLNEIEDEVREKIEKEQTIEDLLYN